MHLYCFSYYSILQDAVEGGVVNVDKNEMNIST